MNASEERVVRALLVIATVAVCGCLICAVGWLHATRSPRLDDLSSTERQGLAEELIEASPGVFRWTWFEPRIGYTLVPDRELTAWRDTFVSNELGYRTGPVAKATGTYRVVFVGDSWTYGMGVRREEAFPEVFAKLANRWTSDGRRIEAWTLALPGYNLLSGLSALEFFFERLKPDAVVICPSGNDNHSTPIVLPNGSLGEAPVPDAFGDPHMVTYRRRQLHSHRFRGRWQTTWKALGRTMNRLRRHRIPVLLAFIARWDASDVHAHLAEAGVEARFFVVSPEYTVGAWEGPPPIGHGNPEAHQLYGRWVYLGLAPLLGWPTLPHRSGVPDPIVYARPSRLPDAPPFVGWTEWTRQQVPLGFRPGQVQPAQRVAGLDVASGEIGRVTTLLVRTRQKVRWLHIAVRRITGAPSLYPLPLSVTIPSPQGGSRVATVVPQSGPEPHRFAVEIPSDLPPGSTLDVTFEAERAVAASDRLAGRSLIVESIDSRKHP